MMKQPVLFVTDELFLPSRNGSQRIYSAVARQHALDGSEIFAVSFYRDAKRALSPVTQASYRELFRDFLLLPGWNNGGRLSGKIGQALREAHRSLTGNVFASHPFLMTKRRREARDVCARLRGWGVNTIYFHKIHALQLAGKIVDLYPDARVILDLHDDFVARAIEYATAYDTLFGTLQLKHSLRGHAGAWVRHHLTRVNVERSRRTEIKLLKRCDEILVASPEEAEKYASFTELAGKVLHAPWPREPAQLPRERDVSGSADFHAGFIGSEDVMNLDALVHFRDDMLPLIRQRVPDFRFLVAGTVATKVGPILRDVPNVTVWRRLERVEEFYNRIQVTVVPLRRGTGVSVKVLEALAFGRPIVSTRAGVRGLAPERISGVAVADDPAAFAAAVIERLDRPLEARV